MSISGILASVILRAILLAASPILIVIALKEWMEDDISLLRHLRICWSSYWDL